jgi:hypothetical protein
LSTEEKNRLKRKEAELIKRLERLKRAMNETRELETLAFKGKLFKEVQEELRHLQERLADIEAEGKKA